MEQLQDEIQRPKQISKYLRGNRDNSENNTQLQQQQKSLALRYKTIKQKCYKRRKRNNTWKLKVRIETQYFRCEKMSKKIKSLKALRNNTEKKKKDIQKINSTVVNRRSKIEN